MMLKDQFLLDADIAFLNHGSFGACPRPVFEVYQNWQRQLERQPVQFLGVELDGYLFKARCSLADYLNTSAKDIVFIPNATHGVNLVARSLPLCPGDEILTTDQEYGACNYAWDLVCKKTGAIYKQHPVSIPVTTTDQIIEEFWHGVTPKTKLIYISHIASPTSLTFPVKQICKRARQAGILSIVDGAHAPGQMQIDIDGIQADFYIGNCHKWMLCPKGVGFLHARPEVQHLIEPLIVSWGYQSRFTAPRESIFIDTLQWTGTRDPAAALSVPAAIEFMHENHWREVRDSCHQLLKSAIRMLSELTGLTPLYPLDSPFFQQMATIPLPRMSDLTGFKQRLLEDYKIEIPCIDWNNHHYLRMSIQAYNSSEDVDRLISALITLLPLLRRNE